MKTIIANWKMYLGEQESLSLAKLFVEKLNNSEAEIIIAPSFLYFEKVKAIVGNTTIKLAGQNVSAEGKGADTGEISAEMLRKAGAEYVIVGHSERRQKLGESDALIHEKLVRCLAAGLKPILCVGETAEERQTGKRDEVLIGQLRSALAGLSVENIENILIAYEPVWAIGSGEPMLATEMLEICTVLEQVLADLNVPKGTVRILYGGSVTADNAAEFLRLDYVAGLLVGGASTREEFLRIVNGS